MPIKNYTTEIERAASAIGTLTMSDEQVASRRARERAEIRRYQEAGDE